MVVGVDGCSVLDLHRNAGVFNSFTGVDFKNAVAVARFELVAIKAVGEAKAAALLKWVDIRSLFL